jgi:hypothetical protein
LLGVLATGVIQVHMRLEKVSGLVLSVQLATFPELDGVIVMLVKLVRKKHQQVRAVIVQQESITLGQPRLNAGHVKQEHMLPRLHRTRAHSVMLGRLSQTQDNYSACFVLLASTKHRKERTQCVIIVFLASTLLIKDIQIACPVMQAKALLLKQAHAATAMQGNIHLQAAPV